MNQLTNLSDDADQLLTVLLDDGSSLTLELIYRPAIQRWSISITHPLLAINGFTVCQGPNILRQWRNVIPFGICVISSTGLDPINSTDFQDGSVAVYILSADEVAQVEADILSPIPLVNP